MNKQKNDLKEWYQTAFNMKYRIGMRVIKTSLLIMICLIISRFMNNDTDFMIISSSAALVTLRTSHKDTLRSGIFRTLGTMFGGLLGILCVLVGQVIPYYSEGLYILIIPLMIVLNLYVCNVLNIQDASVISCVVLLLVSVNVNMPLKEAMEYAGNRLIDTSVGVTITTIFNNLFFPYSESIDQKKDNDK